MEIARVCALLVTISTGGDVCVKYDGTVAISPGVTIDQASREFYAKFAAQLCQPPISIEPPK